MPGVRHFIVATAGHVDHGKSALVTALTGTNPDRLPEEKLRGITIDLGFAEWDLTAPSGDNFNVGIIDVPGHEDFVKNMVAGVGAADLALLIVAADDGWMPQTEEHLQVLTYLGVKYAVVVLTKADLAIDIERATDAVRQRLRNTIYEDAEIVSTSVVSGRGIEELTATVGRRLAEIPPPRDIGKPRLSIDRVFTLTGIGTVVTGTLVGGQLQEGQEVVVQPAGRRSRIRRMQSHGRDLKVSGPGRRIALNLPDITADELHRGDVVTLEAFGGPSQTLDILVEMSTRCHRTLRSGARVRVHHGSGNVGAVVVLSGEDELAGGGRSLAQLRLDRPVFVFEGDRLTIRDWAEQFTLAGGSVLDVDARPRTFRKASRGEYLMRRAEALNDPAAWIESVLARDAFVRQRHLLLRSGFSEADIEDALGRMVASNLILRAGDSVCLAGTWAKFRHAAVVAIDAHHESNPDRLGLPLTELRALLGAIGMAGVAFDALVADVCNAGFVREGVVVRRTTHRPALPSALDAAGSAVRARLADKPFDPPSRRMLAPDAAAMRALRFLVESGEVVEISADVAMSAEGVKRATEAVVALILEGGASTVSQIRERLGCSRRVAVPFLEYLDRTGVTVRHGDQRTLRS